MERSRVHIAFTDILTCPACGPGNGLILLADRIEDRRVIEGRLGCPSCHAEYPVDGGFADVRAAPRADAPVETPEPAGGDEALRLAALMGLTEGRGFALAAGPWARHAPGVAAAVEGLEVAAVDPGLRAWSEEPGVNRMTAAGPLPFYDASLRAVALAGEWADALEEGARVLSPVGRLVVAGAPSDAEDRLRGLGFSRVVREGDLVVAARH